MAPKKSKGSSSSATPIPDEARARALYKQLGAKKGWVESVRSDAQNPDFIHCLARTRVLLDNKELPDKKPKDAKEMAAFLKVALEVYTKLPDGCERPPGQPLSSLGMLVARAKLLQLLADEQQLKKEQLVEGLESISKQIKKGFSRDEWHKVWFDPKSDQCKELKEDDKAACSNMVLLAGSAAEQLLEAHSTYGRVYLQHLLTETDPDIRAAREELPTVPALKQPWGTEAAAAKDAANTAKAAAPASKQLDPKKALQQRKEQEQQMQQRKPGGRDTERARDTKRSKPAQDDKHQQELDAARNKEKEAKEDAAKVLDYLEKRLLAGGSSASSSAQQHMARLQEESRVSLEVLRKAIASLGNRDAKDKDKTELPQELQWCRQQLGDTNPSDNVLKQQLQQLQEKGPSAWQVWYDETVASKAASGGKAPKALYDSWEDFEEHVVHTHLVSAPDSMPLAFKDDTSEELAADVYKNKGQLQQPVADAAADAVRSGSVDSSSPWLKAFDKECPLQRFSLSMGSLRTEDHFITSVTTGFDGLRVQVACGFALLQAERQQVAVDRLQLSRKPAWAVLAYHSLRLLPAIVGDALVVDSDHYVTYNYWGNAEASSEDYARILQPNAQDASANGSTEDAALFTDGLAEDNATMLGMLRKDGMLCGPLLLALQLYLSKAAGTCLDLGSSKAQAKQQGRSSSGGVEFDREAVLGALRQLPERQQLELRLFLLRALYDCYAGLSAYVEFVQAEAQQRQRPAQVPVEVAGGGKEKGKDKGELALVLSQEFYEQACVSAAAPPEYHDGCCNKHHSQRLQAEAEGKQYSKFECSSLEEMMCPDQDMIIQADASVMQRYLLQPARVEPLMEQQGLQIGSRLGLKALVDALFGVGKHEQQLKALLGAPAEDAIKRSSWDKARTDMAIAAQLALHRRQLAALVEEDEAHLSDSNNSQWTRHDLKKRMRALLAQRSAGADWVLRMWMEHFKEQLAALRAEETSLQDQLRSLSDAPEKDKGAKGGSKENPKEREEALNRKLQQVNAGIVNAETALANVKVALNKAVNEAEGFSDLIRATYSCESAQTDSLLQALTLLTNELLTDSHPSTAGVAAQLGEALWLSRLALFDLDVWVMGHALTARRHVLSSMWKHAQPRAVLALSTEALKSHLKEGISKRAELELLALEEESKQTQQQQQPQQGKAAGKKKKKKGGAAKPAGPSLMDRIAGSDSENEEDEAAAAAEAEAEEAAKAAAEEDEEEQEEQEEDGWNNKLNIDMAKLDFQPVHHSKARTDSRDKEHGSSSSSSRAASSQAAAAAAPARPAGRGEAAAGGAAGAHPAASRGPRAAAAADADPVIPGVNSPEVCATCGSIGHLATRCPEHYCSTCHKHGHPDGKCDTACSNCGKMHPGRHACKLGPCHFCKLWGHERVICPAERCLSCNYRGHKAMRCPGVCRRCGKHGHVAAQCNAKPCPTCQQFGHEYGSPECGQQSNSSSSSRRPPAAEAGRPASGSRPPQQAAAAAAPRPAVSGAAAAPAAAAGPQLFKASNLRLQSGEPDEQQRGEFIEKLFNANSAALVNYAMGLIEQRAKASVLARLLAADLAQILEQQDPVATLEEVYGHFAVGRMGSKQPTNLLPEGRRAFEEALPQRLRAQLQVGWERAPRWVEVERQLEEAAAGSWGKAERDAFEEAKARARQASFDAEAALKEQRAQQETKKQARQQQQREREQQQREQQQRELERRPSGSGELRPSSNGGSSSTSAWPAPGEPAATAAPPPPAAAGDPPTPAKVSFAAASQQAQEQPAAAMQQPGEPMQQVGAAGISMPPAMLSEQPGHHQQPPMQPYAGMPGQPAPSGQPWAPGMPPPGQQQQQQQFGGMEQQDLPLHAFAGVPQPWMIWHRYGATYAINQLVEVEQMREHLLQAGVQPALEMQVAPLLHGVVMSLLRNLKESNEDASEGLLRLAEMVHLAVKAGPTPPPPMPSPAPMAVLPPHLQRSYQQQPQPAVAHMLPPHLQHHHTPEQQQQQQQQPMWQQQQQQPAGDDDSDDDDLMNILTGSASGAAAAAPGGQQQPAWGGAAGQQQQQHGGPGSEFPALGVERGSGGGGSRAAVPGVSTAGLANETGEYNCFLNVVVQCLYNCRDFRNSVWELPSYVATHPVVVAMRKLFIDMQQAEATWQPGGERIVVNPTALREALDCETHFKQQEMNDAMELLDTLYECFRKAQGAGTVQGSRGVLVDSVFGLLVKEAVACRQPNCGKRTHVIGAHWEHLLVVNSMALTFAAYDAPGGADMGRLLRTLFDQEQKMCDKDEGGCGTQYPPERACEAAPKVLTLQLVWNQDVASSEIESALAHVQEHVDINPLYAGGCDAADTTYELSSAVAYYGQHYMAFVHNTKLHTWLLFDDASVSVVGSWQDVIRKCTAGKIQPSVLFYQTVDLAAVAGGAPPPAMQLQQQQQQMHAPAPMHMGMPAAAGGPGAAPWAGPAAAAMSAGGPPHMAMPGQLQQPHQMYQQPQMNQQPMQQQPVPVVSAAGPYSQPPPQQQQQQQQGGWPAAGPPGATDGSGHGGGWHTVQQPADAAAAWSGTSPAAPAAAAPPPQQQHPAAGAAPSQGAAQQTPAKVAWPGGPGRGGASLAAGALRAATGQAARPGAAPGGGRGRGPTQTGPPPGRGEGPHGGRGPGGRG